MSKYYVTLYYRYKDTQVVEADSPEEARKIAEENANESYECYLDAAVDLVGDDDA